MQRLHVVGFTKDHEGLILSIRRGTKSGAYTVEVDAEFEEVLAELIKERGGEAEPRIARAESQLSVREMQQRLRGGQSIHQVARAAGVTDEWVARFAIPIQAEQAQVVRQAFEINMLKNRLGLSNQPLGISAWWNLQDKSVVLEEDGWELGWSAALLRDNRWLVKFEYTARKKHQVAEWEVDLKAGTLISRNRLGTELGYVEAGRRRRPGPPPPLPGGLVTRALPPVAETPPPAPAPVVEAGETVEEAPAPAKKAARRPAKKAAKRAPLKKVSGGKKIVPKKVAAKKPVAGKKVTAKKVTAKKAAPKRTAAKKVAPKKAAPKKAAPKKAAAKKPAKKPGSARRVGPAPIIVTTPPPRPQSTTEAASLLVSGGTRAREGVPTPNQPNLTPPPSPSASRKRRIFRR